MDYPEPNDVSPVEHADAVVEYILRTVAFERNLEKERGRVMRYELEDVRWEGDYPDSVLRYRRHDVIDVRVRAFPCQTRAGIEGCQA